VIDLHDKRGIQLATCTGEIDLSTPTSRFIARALGAAARHEVISGGRVAVDRHGTTGYVADRTPPRARSMAWSKLSAMPRA
jgi:hypothetical protein